MIRQVKHNNKDYFVVHTYINVTDNNDVITVPVVMQINISSVESKNQMIIYSKIKSLDKGINLGIKPSIIKKPFWKFW